MTLYRSPELKKIPWDKCKELKANAKIENKQRNRYKLSASTFQNNLQKVWKSQLKINCYRKYSDKVRNLLPTSLYT